MSPRHVALIFAVNLSALMFVDSARADDEKQAAREAFRAAEVAFDQGDYRRAALGFEAANEKSPNGGTLFNAGLAWSRASEPARAADDFAKAIDSGELDDRSAKEAASRRAALEPKLARVSIEAPDGAELSVAHVEHAASPLRIYLLPGSHVVRATLPNGEQRQKIIQAVAGASLRVDFAEIEPTEPDRPRASSSQPARDSSPPTTRSPSTPIWPWVAIGSGTAIVAVGGYLRFRGFQANQDFDGSNQTDADARDRAITLRTWSGVALIGGAAIAVTGVVWLILDKKAQHRSSMAPFQLRF